MKTPNLIQSLLREVGQSAPVDAGRAFRVAVSPTEENTPIATVNQDGTVTAALLWDFSSWDQGNWS